MSKSRVIELLANPAIGVETLALFHYHWPRPCYRHVHGSLQVVMILSGQTDVLFQGSDQIHPLLTDQFAIIPPGLAHQVETQGRPQPVELLDARIDLAHRSDLARAWRPYRDRWRIVQGQPTLNAQLRQMLIQAAAMPQPSRDHAMKGIMWQLLALAKRSQGSLRDHHADRRLLTAERFMADHLKDAIGLPEVARACGLSVSQLNRLFVSHRHITPARHLMALRIALARELLPASLLTLKEIARECGFVCVNHFSRAFKQHVGMTPGGYRQHQPSTR